MLIQFVFKIFAEKNRRIIGEMLTLKVLVATIDALGHFETG